MWIGALALPTEVLLMTFYIGDRLFKQITQVIIIHISYDPNVAQIKKAVLY